MSTSSRQLLTIGDIQMMMTLCDKLRVALQAVGHAAILQWQRLTAALAAASLVLWHGYTYLILLSLWYIYGFHRL